MPSWGLSLGEGRSVLIYSARRTIELEECGLQGLMACIQATHCVSISRSVKWAHGWGWEESLDTWEEAAGVYLASLRFFLDITSWGSEEPIGEARATP